MKTTILGIEIGCYAVDKIKYYIAANKKDKKEKTNYSAWDHGYQMAKAENEIERLKDEGKITKEEYKIIYKFIMHIEFKRISKSKLYSKEWI